MRLFPYVDVCDDMKCEQVTLIHQRSRWSMHLSRVSYWLCYFPGFRVPEASIPEFGPSRLTLITIKITAHICLGLIAKENISLVLFLEDSLSTCLSFRPWTHNSEVMILKKKEGEDKRKVESRGRRRRRTGRRWKRKRKTQEEGRYNEVIIFHVISIPEEPFVKKQPPRKSEFLITWYICLNINTETWPSVALRWEILFRCNILSRFLKWFSLAATKLCPAWSCLVHVICRYS